MVYGYARVSTAGQAHDGNGLEVQRRDLLAAGANEIYEEAYTGTKMTRPVFDELIAKLLPGDTLMVVKLDRLSRTTIEGATLIKALTDKGIRVNVLNMGTADTTTSMGNLMVNILLAFAEFERDTIVERTQTGKAIAKLNPGFSEGRPKKYTPSKVEQALGMLDTMSYKQVQELTGISKSTLIRARKAQK